MLGVMSFGVIAVLLRLELQPSVHTSDPGPKRDSKTAQVNRGVN